MLPYCSISRRSFSSYSGPPSSSTKSSYFTQSILFNLAFWVSWSSLRHSYNYYAKESSFECWPYVQSILYTVLLTFISVLQFLIPIFQFAILPLRAYHRVHFFSPSVVSSLYHRHGFLLLIQVKVMFSMQSLWRIVYYYTPWSWRLLLWKVSRSGCRFGHRLFLMNHRFWHSHETFRKRRDLLWLNFMI